MHTKLSKIRLQFLLYPFRIFEGFKNTLIPFTAFISTYILKLQYLLTLFKVGGSKLWWRGQILPTIYCCWLFLFVLMTYELRLIFTFISGYRRIQRKIILKYMKMIWNLKLMSINKVLLKKSYTHSLSAFMVVFPAQQEISVAIIINTMYTVCSSLCTVAHCTTNCSDEF